MERWKRNVLGLLITFAIIYGIYLLWLYRMSGGTMVVTAEPPDWTFSPLIGLIVFALSFGGGLVGLALTNPDLSRDPSGTTQLLFVSTLLAIISTVGALLMTEHVSTLQAITALALGIVALWMLAKKKERHFTSQTIVFDERVEEIDLRSRALAGEVLMMLTALLLLASAFKPLGLDLQAVTLYLLAGYWVSWILAKIHYRRVM